ncbi:MAG: 30S ribosomal protein S18 [Chloroflexota bacterium]
MSNYRPRREEGGSNDDEGRGRRYTPVRKVCTFCADKTAKIDYKNPDNLRRFTTDRGKIRARRKSGACAKHQRAIAVAIKRARQLALMPFIADPQRGS